MITCIPGQRWVFVGDSITALGWFVPLVSKIDAAISALPTRQFLAKNVGPGIGVARAGTGGKGRVQPVSPSPISVTNSGVVGNTAADIAASVPDRINDFNPDVVIVEVGVNDAILGTTGPDFSTAYVSILDQVLAWRASTQIGCVSILCYGEQWPFGTANIDDPRIADLNIRIQAAATTRGGTYLDVRTPAGNYEMTHNLPGPPGAPTGILTFDGTHPNATGQNEMGDWVFPSIDVEAAP